jgi:hypothetical protein
MKSKAIFLLCLGILFAMPVKSWTQWVQANGPSGGYAGAFATIGQNLLVSTSHGIYLTKNNGLHWIAIDTGIHASCFFTNGPEIVAGSSGGIFISSDSGAHRTEADSGLTNPFVTALAGIGNNLFAGTYEGVFISSDNGAHWSSMANGLPARMVSSFVKMKTNLFVGYFDMIIADTGIVYRSADNGLHWTRADTGIADSIYGVRVMSLYATGADLFAGTDCGVFRSVNNGSRWTAVNTGLWSLDGQLPFIGTVTSVGTNLLAGSTWGVYRSMNNGASWTMMKSGLRDTDVVVLTTIGTNVCAGTRGGGVFLSADSGATWNPVNDGLPNMPVKSFAVSGTNLFAGTESGGVFRSNNKGTAWTPVNSGLPNILISSFAVNGADLFAAAKGEGVYHSANNGAHWTKVTGVPNYGIWSIGMSGKYLFAGHNINIYRSQNNGSAWDTTMAALCTDQNIRFSCIAGNGSFALAGYGGCGVTRSTDNGASWVRGNTNFNAGVNAFAWIGGTVLAGAGNGAYCSTDTGIRWTAVNSGLTDMNVHALAAISADLFAGTGRGVFLSADKGLNWTAENTGFPANTAVCALVEADSVLYAGTNSGVWRRPLSDLRTNVHERNQTTQNTFSIQIDRNNSVRYYVPVSALVSIKVFDIKGRLMLSLLNKKQEPGSYQVKMPAGLPQGRYVLSVNAGDMRTDREVIVVR